MSASSEQERAQDGTEGLAVEKRDGAGRELDALIAEKVFGIVPRDIRVCGEVDTPLVRVWSASAWFQDGRQDRYQLNMHGAPRPYSTEIATAWAVVEKMRERDLTFVLNATAKDCQGVTWAAWFENDAPTFGDTAPLAICHAALKALAPSPERSV